MAESALLALSKQKPMALGLIPSISKGRRGGGSISHSLPRKSWELGVILLVSADLRNLQARKRKVNAEGVKTVNLVRGWRTADETTWNQQSYRWNI